MLMGTMWCGAPAAYLKGNFVISCALPPSKHACRWVAMIGCSFMLALLLW